MSEDDLGRLFTRQGDDAWRLVSYCRAPSVVFENLETKERRGGAVGSLLVEEFKPLREVKP